MTSRSTGYFAVIEGIDGAGKSTVARLLAAKLSGAGRDVLLTREPTDGPYGKKIRELASRGRDEVTPEDELALFIADRRDHVREEIAPALAAGRIVIQDRYYYSTMAYQGARGLDPLAIREMHREFAPEPDLLAILDLPVAEGLERIRGSRGETPNLFERREALEKVSAIFARVEHPNLIRLDARRPAAESAERLEGEIKRGLAARGLA